MPNYTLPSKIFAVFPLKFQTSVILFGILKCHLATLGALAIITARLTQHQCFSWFSFVTALNCSTCLLTYWFLQSYCTDFFFWGGEAKWHFPSQDCTISEA